MKKIETLKDLNELIDGYIFDSPLSECILKVYDNKSDCFLQTIPIRHPVSFIRGIQEFCKSLNLPVSDVSVQLIGFLKDDNSFISIDEIVEISPYVYFNKPKEDVDSSEDN